MGNDTMPVPVVIFVLAILITSMLFAGAITLTCLLIGAPAATPVG